MNRAGTMDVFGYLESMRYRYGLYTADIWNWSLASLDQEHIQAVRGALVEREMRLAALSTDGSHLWEDDPAARAYNHRMTLEHMRVAESMGANMVRIDAGAGVDTQTFGEEQIDLLATRYREYAQRAHDNGYKIGAENHYGAERNPLEMRRLAEAVDHPGFGLILHVGNWRGENADRGDAMTAPWTIHVHLPDSLTDEGLAEPMALLRNTGYVGTWCIEFEGGATYAQAGVMIARVQSVLEGWRLAAT